MAKFIKTELGAYLNAKAISVIETNVNYWSCGGNVHASESR